ncbi:hypothetical protein [Desulfomonile tiedjei]|uniref:Uncharacterized protein n=1 Tax=Desulfomonile tiedjei (strain ATCC 49306 / DSM 6799 / DCB-1) TaxID=706587 RepID=I4C194_DESTA|nr:hypothetical protein [Desulfomonile tiedjei]AFM23335.1 hypothetical protein Desti_0607 [Desulfomonile tiedjei DSM 6799]
MGRVKEKGQEKVKARAAKSKESRTEPLVEESLKPLESEAEPYTGPDDPKIMDMSQSAKSEQGPQPDSDQVAPTPPLPAAGEQPPAISLIPHEKFKEQINALRKSTTIKNDKGEEVEFEGEDKEQFIRLAEEAYPIAEKMAMTMTETGRFLGKVRHTLKPKKLFLTWMKITGFPERNSYNYMHVYERFGDKLPLFSHLGIRKLLAAAHLKDCVEYVEKHEEVIARESAEEFEKKVRNRVEASKKKSRDGRGRKPKYTALGECKLRLSGDGTKISVEGLSKKQQSALFEAIKGWLSQENV